MVPRCFTQSPDTGASQPEARASYDAFALLAQAPKLYRPLPQAALSTTLSQPLALPTRE
jgi:hypothetical protein